MSQFDQYNEEQHSIQHLLRYASKYEPIKDRNIEARWIKMAQSDYLFVRRKAEKFLVDHNLRLIIKQAKKFMGKGVPLQDLINEGCHGLIYAISKFDLSLGYKLSTYATWWIRQKMGRANENISRIIRVPTNKQAEVTQLNKKYMELRIENNCPPTSYELAKALGWTVERTEMLGRMVFDIESLDKKAGEDENLSLIDYVLDENPLPEVEAESSLDWQYMNDSLKILSAEDQRFIKMRFGFIDNKPRKDREMSSLFKISIKQVKEKEAQILEKLRNNMSIDKVNLFG